MLQMAICDDNSSYLDYAIDLFEKEKEGRGVEWEVHPFSCSEELMDYMKLGEKQIDLIFMDISLGDENGIEVAKAVNTMYPKCKIAFLTNHLHYATDVYETEHCYFILKEELEDRLWSVISKVVRLNTYVGEKIVLNVKGKRVFCNRGEIMYAARNYRVTEVCCVDRTIRCSANIPELCKMFTMVNFVRCHNSFIVNLEYVKDYKRNEFIMDEDVHIPISRKYMNDVKMKFLQWRKDLM